MEPTLSRSRSALTPALLLVLVLLAALIACVQPLGGVLVVVASSGTNNLLSTSFALAIGACTSVGLIRPRLRYFPIGEAYFLPFFQY